MRAAALQAVRPPATIDAPAAAATAAAAPATAANEAASSVYTAERFFLFSSFCLFLRHP